MTVASRHFSPLSFNNIVNKFTTQFQQASDKELELFQKVSMTLSVMGNHGYLDRHLHEKLETHLINTRNMSQCEAILSRI
jgi:hypothetical protein